MDVLHRDSLHIETNATVDKVHFEGNKARAVGFISNGVYKHAKVGKEIILSAGAVGSPCILQRSGVPRRPFKGAGHTRCSRFGRGAGAARPPADTPSLERQCAHRQQGFPQYAGQSRRRVGVRSAPPGPTRNGRLAGGGVLQDHRGPRQLLTRGTT